MDIKYDQVYCRAMKSIGSAKFKEHCLSLLNEVSPEGIVITKHGKPVARLVPVGSESAPLIGCLKDKVKVKGDIFSTGLKWRAQS